MVQKKSAQTIYQWEFACQEITLIYYARVFCLSVPHPVSDEMKKLKKTDVFNFFGFHQMLPNNNAQASNREKRHKEFSFLSRFYFRSK